MNLGLLKFILKHTYFPQVVLNCDTLKDICLSLTLEGVFQSLTKGVPLKDAAEWHYGKCR